MNYEEIGLFPPARQSTVTRGEYFYQGNPLLQGEQAVSKGTCCYKGNALLQRALLKWERAVTKGTATLGTDRYKGHCYNGNRLLQGTKTIFA